MTFSIDIKLYLIDRFVNRALVMDNKYETLIHYLITEVKKNNIKII